jgi:sarcosine oxidase subunit alpha
MQAESQNRWPSLALDLGAINSLFAPFIPAGFYYKTFMWPRGAWRTLYEPNIRKAAGLGRSPTLPDPDRYTHRYAHCEVLIVGAGPAGLTAALAAAQSGSRVVLCDEQAELGGSLLAETQATIDGRAAQTWLAETVDALKRFPRVLLLPRTTAFGYFAHNMIGLCERLSEHLAHPDPHQPRERQWQVRANQVVLATGAIERPLVFSGNDRPGIMLASAARVYLNRYGVLPGKRVVIAAASDEAYRAALDFHAAGISIAAIADVRVTPSGPLVEAARMAGLQMLPATTVVKTSGRLRVSAAELASSTHAADSTNVSCDLILMSGGLVPSVHLFSQSRGKLQWSENIAAYIPAASPEKVQVAGACRGVFTLQEALRDGAVAGSAAAGVHLHGFSQPLCASTIEAHAARFTGIFPPPKTKAFVDWQNDVTAQDLLLAAREGFQSIEHVKRYTTTGMATDQGKTSNLNTLEILSRELNISIPEIGLTTFRMPYTPVTFGSFAGFARGELFDPIRTTPMHEWAVEAGAVFQDVGQWKRARYFPKVGEDMHAAVARECSAVRNACGIFDASTLGKIEVVGKDAPTFLERMYVNNWTTLAVGRARYGILLREDGFIFDDGVIARLAPDRFHVTTTTGGAGRVLAMMEDYLQTEWSDLCVWLTSTTEQWAVIAIQGPATRRVLEPLIDGVDISTAALPHMSVTQARIYGVPMRLFRVSFTGELGFEVNVPADYGTAVWEAILEAGREQGITPYGLEANHVLRAEKGYIIVGQDTDGTVTLNDAGLNWAMGKNKADFVGKRSQMRPALNAADRKQLVGLLSVDPTIVLEEGAQLSLANNISENTLPIGHVTSAYYSSTLGRSIALGLVAAGRARHAQTLYASMASRGDIPVQVTSPVFYDAEGSRLHA